MKSFFDLAKERYSVRAYLPQAVEDEKLQKVLEAGLLAPTAKNRQPQKIYVVKSDDMKKKLAAVTPCTFNAPVILVICYDETIACQGKVYENYSFGNTDAAIVGAHMMLEAADLGLGTCWVGWFCEKEVKDALGLPENIRVCDLMPIGYTAPDAHISDMHYASRTLADTVEFI